LIVKFPSFDTFPNATNLIRIFDAKAIDNDFEDNGMLNYFIDDALSSSFFIDTLNGSVYFNFFQWNITNLEQLRRFRGSFQLVLRARDSGRLPLVSSLNFTLYLNYDESELSFLTTKYAESTSKEVTADLDEFELLTSEFESGMKKNFFQLVSNGVLLVILLTVLMFMLFVACFLFIIFYKKNSRGAHKTFKEKTNKASKENDGNNVVVTSRVNYELSNGRMVKCENGRNKNGAKSCLSGVTDRFKQRCGVVKSESFGNLNSTRILSKKRDQSLTVTFLNFLVL
jgi:hypothetical protein